MVGQLVPLLVWSGGFSVVQKTFVTRTSHHLPLIPPHFPAFHEYAGGFAIPEINVKRLVFYDEFSYDTHNEYPEGGSLP